MIKADIKPLIKKVRIPYMGTESFPMEEDRREGADGLATKVFLPSITELNGALTNTYKEGAALSYFRTEQQPEENGPGLTGPGRLRAVDGPE